MNNKVINILLVIVTVAVLVLLAFRVRFEPQSSPGCCGRDIGGVSNK